jgi:hypothetical protein
VRVKLGSQGERECGREGMVSRRVTLTLADWVLLSAAERW